MPRVKRNKPKIERLLNFSFRIKNEKSIVSRIDNLPIELTAIGLALTKFKALYSNNQLAPVAIPDSVRNIQELAVMFFAPL